MNDRLRETAHQIDMAQNGFSLPWAKKHLSPLLRESAERIASLESALNKAAGNWAKADERARALEDLVKDMYDFIDSACKQYPRMFDPNIGAGGQMVREMPNDRYAERMKELGVM